MRLKVLKDIYAIYKFNSYSDIPSRIYGSKFYSVAKTEDEISVVCKQSDYINNAKQIDKGWKVLKILGSFDFSLIGIIAEISKILYEYKIPIFTISTYETDYILVKSDDLDKAMDSLRKYNHEVIEEK